MNKYSLIVLFLILTLSLIGCNQTPKTVDNSKIIKDEPPCDSNFERFKANFKPIALDNLKKLGVEFNDRFLVMYDTTLEVQKAYKESYLKNLNMKYAYYGFKTELPNKSIMLTFLNHYGAEDVKDGEVIDTSFFLSLVFNGSGKLQSSFRTFGSNLTGEPPTYNMKSAFEYEENKLIITNYEYSIGKNLYEAKPMPGSDSIYMADLTTTKYYLSYATNEIVPINKSRSKAMVVMHYRNPLPVYLKPIE